MRTNPDTSSKDSGLAGFESLLNGVFVSTVSEEGSECIASVLGGVGLSSLAPGWGCGTDFWEARFMADVISRKAFSVLGLSVFNFVYLNKIMMPL